MKAQGHARLEVHTNLGFKTVGYCMCGTERGNGVQIGTRVYMTRDIRTEHQDGARSWLVACVLRCFLVGLPCWHPPRVPVPEPTRYMGAYTFLGLSCMWSRPCADGPHCARAKPVPSMRESGSTRQRARASWRGGCLWCRAS